MTTKLLANQYRSILADPVEGFTVALASESSLYDWIVYIEGPRETCYEGGVFQLSLSFPKDYPMNPPVLKFISDFWHPNVYVDGKVCMSILHPPGDDAMSGELARERWLPTQSVTTIVLSLLSLLNDPNCSSPANVDASVEWRKHRDSYIKKCQRLVEKANREKPSDVVIPHPDTNEDEHRRIVQKWKEMNKDLDYDDFYEHNEDEDENENEDEESEEEGEDEDELLESNSEMKEEDEDDEEAGKAAKDSAKEPETVAQASASEPSIATSSSSSSLKIVVDESGSSSTYQTTSSSKNKEKEVIEEIHQADAGPSNSAGPRPENGNSNSNSNPNPNSNMNSISNNNSDVSNDNLKGKKKKSGIKSNKKKCIIM